MKRRNWARRLGRTLFAGAAIVALASVALEGRATGPDLKSTWPDGEIAIDGSGAGWTSFSPFGKDTGYSVAVKNDYGFLYIALATSDARAKMQTLRQGLIVWFDAKGGTKKQLGIEYPVAAFEGAPQGYGRGDRPSGGDRSGGGYGRGGSGGQTGRSGGFDPDRLWEQVQQSGRLNQLQILGSSKDDRRMVTIEGAAPIEARIGMAEGRLVYELKVPIMRGGKAEYAIGADPGAIIGVGLQTPEADQGQGRRAPGGGGFGGRGGFGGQGGLGGRGGFGGRGGLGGAGYGGSNSPGAAKPLNSWITVQLAK